MIRGFILFFCLLLAGMTGNAQVAISADNSQPDPSAGLDVKFTTKGMLPPRMTRVQRNQIPAPAEGLLVICLDCLNDSAASFCLYSNGSWHILKGFCTTPLAPVAGTHIATNTSIQWQWNPVSNAAGYKWGTLGSVALANDIGPAVSKTETGLMYSTNYTRYVWAYNDCGVSTFTTLSQSTLAWVCGTGTLVVNHVTGSVAPVTKSVTYGTVTNIPGETSKCWITRNLGASQQATAVNDDTELSAGWYWQFNRKQGYKHDGTALTPAWTTSPINENSDWTTENDPCQTELGAGWRIPTNTEWTNVKTAGTWTNWNGPWNSGLKINAAGYLDYLTGSLNSRGTEGFYWGSTQNGAPYGQVIQVNSSFINLFSNYKTFGYSVRCLKGN